MDANAVVVAVIRSLNAANIPFMLVGSLSSNAYGIERATKDADLVLQLGSMALSKIFSNLPAGFVLQSQIGLETITSTTRYRIDYTPLPFSIELFELSNDPHDQLRFANRRPTTFRGEPAFLPRPEDVVITKIRWFSIDPSRTKDIEDVRNVLAVQKPAKLDLPYIRQWTYQHGTRELFEKLLAETPDV